MPKYGYGLEEFANKLVSQDKSRLAAKLRHQLGILDVTLWDMVTFSSESTSSDFRIKCVQSI